MGTEGIDLDAVLLSIAAALEQDWYDDEELQASGLAFEGWAAGRIDNIAEALEILKSVLVQQAE